MMLSFNPFSIPSGVRRGYSAARVHNMQLAYEFRLCRGYLPHIIARIASEAGMNKRSNFESMTVDEMWFLYEELCQVLSVRLTSEKRELEKRLAQLQRENKTLVAESFSQIAAPRERRTYPRVLPKYRNPSQPSETWSGRGKTPRWLAAALKDGRTISEFAIDDPHEETDHPRGA